MADERKFLNRDEILAAPDLGSQDVYVPEWGGWVRVRALSGAERDRFESEIAEVKGRKTQLNLANVRAKLVALAAIDENGGRLFRPSDVEALGVKSAAALDRVFDAAMRLAGMRNQDIEELMGNFPEGQSDGFTSA